MIPHPLVKVDALQPSIVTYGTAISACGANFEWPLAIALLDDLREKQIESNAVVSPGNSKFIFYDTD